MEEGHPHAMSSIRMLQGCFCGNRKMEAPSPIYVLQPSALLYSPVLVSVFLGPLGSVLLTLKARPSAVCHLSLGSPQILHRHQGGARALVQPFNKGQCPSVALVSISSRAWLSKACVLPPFGLDFSHALEFASSFVWSGVSTFSARL